MRSRAFKVNAVLSICIGLAASCGSPRTSGSPSSAPPAETINAWIRDYLAKYPDLQTSDTDTRLGFRAGVDQVNDAVRGRHPLHITLEGLTPFGFIRNGPEGRVVYWEEVSGSSFEMITEGDTEAQFGLPLKLTGACYPSAFDTAKEAGMDNALAWYASKRIYAVNSTKRKHP